MAPYSPLKALALLERALTAEPTRSLRALVALRAELDVLERHLVARALQEGQTYTRIATPLGISRQAAHRRYRDLTGPPTLPAPPTLSEAARAALHRARQEAAEQGSRSIDGEHLALALADAGALQLDVEAARRSFAPPRFDASEPAGLDPSLHAKLARNAGVLSLDDLVQATLEDAGARRLLDRFGSSVQPRAHGRPVANGRSAGTVQLAERLHHA